MKSLKRGRWIEPGRDDEAVLSEPFADANGLGPGDSLAALINGRRRALRVVGIGLSPEYVYTIRPGEVIPDDRRFGIVWMERRALAAAFDMEGGFNDASLKLMRGASSDEVTAGLDRLLARYGALGAIPRRLQMSHWTLVNELTLIDPGAFSKPVTLKFTRLSRKPSSKTTFTPDSFPSETSTFSRLVSS